MPLDRNGEYGGRSGLRQEVMNLEYQGHAHECELLFNTWSDKILKKSFWISEVLFKFVSSSAVLDT